MCTAGIYIYIYIYIILILLLLLLLLAIIIVLIMTIIPALEIAETERRVPTLIITHITTTKTNSNNETNITIMILEQK